jgi:hypothetical protein
MAENPQYTPQITDEAIVDVIVKIRAARKTLKAEYEAADKNLTGQREQLDAELLRRLRERGATQTKTPAGTAFLGEDLSVTIADEAALFTFLDQEEDPYGWFQKRIKVERLREYQSQHEGGIPPGLSIFREATINVRAS